MKRKYPTYQDYLRLKRRKIERAKNKQVRTINLNTHYAREVERRQKRKEVLEEAKNILKLPIREETRELFQKWWNSNEPIPPEELGHLAEMLAHDVSNGGLSLSVIAKDLPMKLIWDDERGINVVVGWAEWDSKRGIGKLLVHRLREDGKTYATNKLLFQDALLPALAIRFHCEKKTSLFGDDEEEERCAYLTMKQLYYILNLKLRLLGKESRFNEVLEGEQNASV